MSTQFPTSLDALTNPTATDKVSVVSHADQHIDANDAIEAIQAKVGIDGSAVTASHDFKLSSLTDGEKVVSPSGNQTIAGNKTFTGTTTTNGLNAGSGNIITTGDVTATNVLLNDAKISASGSIETHSDVDFTGKAEGMLPTYNASSGKWEAADPAPVNIPTPDVIKMIIGNDKSADFQFFTDDTDVKFSTTATEGLRIYKNGQYREFLKTEIGGADVDTINGVSFLNDDVYVITSDNTVFVKMFRINGYDDLSTATVTEIDVTTNSVFSVTNANSIRFSMDKDGAIYISNIFSGPDIRKTSIASDVLSIDSNINFTGTITAVAFGGLGISLTGDIIVSDSSANYERYNQSGVSQEYVTGFFTSGAPYMLSYYDGSEVSLFANFGTNNYADQHYKFPIV